MIVVMKKNTRPGQLDELVRIIESEGLRPGVRKGDIKTIVEVFGDTAQKSAEPYERLSYVEKVFRVQDKEYSGISKEHQDHQTTVRVDEINIGSDKLTLINL